MQSLFKIFINFNVEIRSYVKSTNCTKVCTLSQGSISILHDNKQMSGLALVWLNSIIEIDIHKDLQVSSTINKTPRKYAKKLKIKKCRVILFFISSITFLTAFYPVGMTLKNEEVKFNCM